MAEDRSELQMEAELWSGPMGERWLAHRDQFESMIAQFGDGLIAKAAFKPGERVIDIGCGGGATSLQIARIIGPKGSVTGLDISAALIGSCEARARKEGVANARFVVGDASKAEFSEAAFDRLFSRFGVMFFSDPYAAFAHMHGLLKPGGRADFACWGPPKENLWVLELMELTRRYVDRPPTPPRSPGPFAFAEADYVREILEHAGFSGIDISSWRGDQFVGGRGADPETAAGFVLEALSFADALKELPPEKATQARKELVEIMARHHGPQGVRMSGMSWFVAARA